MYKSIVVGTDGSSTAQGAVTAAIALARALDARLHVVSVYNNAQMSTAIAAGAGIAASSVAELDQAAREHTNAVLDGAKARASADGVEVVLHPCVGSPAEVLTTIAAGEGADLIVVGNRGMKGARRLLGSVPNHVAHHAPCAVLIVPTA